MQNIFLEEFGTLLEFPDNFSDSQIQSALDKNILPQLRREAEEEEEARRREVKDNTSLGSAFGTGLSRGISQTKSLLTDALPAIAADIVGADDYRDRQLEEYNQAMQRIEQETPSAVPTFKDIESIGDASLYAAETVGQFIPSIVTSIFGGGVGGFVGKKAAEKFATKMAKDAADKAIKKGTTAGFVAGTFVGSGSQTIPEAYTTIAEETGEPNAAAGLIVGSINASLDSLLPLGLAKTLTKDAKQQVARSLFSRLMRGAGKGAVVEGLTEGVQEANQLIASDIINENPDLLRGENVDRILEASLRGAIGGKVFGTIGGIAGESPKQRQAREDAQGRAELEQDIQTVRDDTRETLMPEPPIALPAPKTGIFDTTRTPTQTSPGTPSELTIAETLQFAEQNRGRDEQINNILDSLTSPDKAGIAADRIRKRLAELNVGPQLARDTLAMRSGQPNDELVDQIVKDSLGRSKGGKQMQGRALPFEEGTLVDRPELRKARYVKETKYLGSPSYERISKKEFDELKAKPQDGVRVFENPVSIEKRDPLAPASDPILQPEEGITKAFATNVQGKPRPRLPQAPLTEEQEAQLVELEKAISELEALGGTSTLDVLIQRMRDGKNEFKQEQNDGRIRIIKNQAEKLKQVKDKKQRGSDGKLTEEDIETDYVDYFLNDFRPGQVEDAFQQPNVRELVDEARNTANALNLKINEAGYSRKEARKGEQRVKFAPIDDAMTAIGSDVVNLIKKAKNITRGNKTGDQSKLEEVIQELEKSLTNANKLLGTERTPPPPPPTPQFTGFKVKNTEIIDERTGEKRDKDMWGDIVEVSDGIENRYLAWEDPDGSTVIEPDNGWYEVDKFGNPIGPKGNLYARLPDLKRDKKEAVNMLREDMAIKSGDEMALQQLVEEGVISEQLALDNIRASAATNANQDPAIKVKSPVEVKAENVAGARARIDARLENLRTAGPQGRRLADAIVKSIFNMDLSVSQVAVAFDSADILNQILPADADQTIGFFNKLFAQTEVVERSGGEGTEVYGLNVSKTKDNINGMIQIALGLDEQTIKQTAAHEAFHTLQDFFSSYDKGSEGILNDFFGKPNEIVEFDKTGASKYIKRLNRPLYNALRGKTLEAGELAAYTFQSYDSARRNGAKVPGTGGAVRRFFNFISQFLPRLANSIRGRGFRSLQDVLKDASTGTTAQRLQGLSKPDVGDGQRARSVGESATNLSSLIKSRPYGFTFRAPDLTEPETGFAVAPLKSAELIVGEKFSMRDMLEYIMQTQKIGEIFNTDIYFGGWFNSEDGKYYLDSTLVVPEYDKALYIAEAGRQEGIFDIANLEEVRTNDAVQRLKQEGAYRGEAAEQSLRDITEADRIFTSARNESGGRFATRDEVQDAFGRQVRASAIAGVNSQNEYRVSTRYPTAGKRTEDPEASILTVGPDEITENPTILKKAAQLIRGYNVLSKKESRGGDRLIVEKFINRLTDNLLYVFDSIDPAVRERSKLWYVGANKIANDLAKEFNIQPHIAAGVIAATSPQKDWFMNASLARRIIDIKANHMDFQFTPEMQQTADRIFGAKKYKELLDIVSGRKGRNDTSLGSLDVLQKSPVLQAMWIRIYDETYNDRSHKAISPEGQFTETVLNAKGKPVKTGWGSLAEIAKGVAVLDNPATINAEMGSQNKIRSFMNNIIAPFGVFGDVTIDTHAVAAALLKPLSSKSTQVHHNFGSSPQPKDQGADWTGGTSNSTVTGVSGLYGLYAEAYRRAAEKRGVLPREMQSITWEAVRGLFPAKYKTKENVNKINNIWNRYQKGAITLDQTRQEILDASPRGFQAPAWAGPRSGATGNTGSTSDTQELSGVQLSRRDTDPVDSGTGSPATSRASAVSGVRASPRVQPIGQTGGMIDLISSGNTQGVMESIGAPFLRYFKSGRVIDDLINRFNPLAELDKMTNAGKLKDATESAFKFAELATNMSGRSEFALLHGNLVYNKTTGELDVDPNSEGLLEIFKDIGTGDNYRNFQMYAIARRAVTLKQDTQRRISVLNQKIAQSKDKREKKKLKADLVKMQERQKNLDEVFTGARIADGMSYENAQFRDVFDRYNKFNQKTLQFLVDTEIISEAQKDAMSIDYIPYYRMMEEEEFGTRKGAIRNSILGPKTTNVLNNPDAGIKELTGRSGAIGDLYENIIKNNTAMISAGLKNVSMGRALKTMEQEGMATRVPSKIGQDSEFVVTYYENGNKVFMDMTDANGELTDFNHRMFMALSSFSPPQLTGLMDMVQKVTGIFRDAITLAPNFMLANLIRGDIAGYVTVDADFKPLFGTMKGFKNVITNDRVSEEMKAVAGVGGYSYGQNTQDYSRTFKRQLKPEWNAAQVLPKFINGLRTVGEASELATRDAIYRAILDKGGNKTEAGYQALNLVNFNRRGNPQTRAGQVLSLFLPMIPFLNARIQGLYRTTTALTGAEANRRKAIMRMGMLGGISMMIYMMNKDDERWDDEPLYRKMTYDIIYLGDYRLLIPKAFEVGALAQTLPQVLTEVVSGDRNSSYAADAAGHTFMNTFSFNPIPQVIKPLLEVYTNYDFFREREIESARMRNLPKDQRSATTTPEALRQLGQVTDAINLSPVQLETLIRGYLGTLGMTSIATMDTVMSQVGLIPEKPEGIMPFGDIVGLNRFVREGADPANRWVGEVYDLRREANEIYSGVRALREEGRVDAARELMRDNRQLLGTRKQVNKLAQTISDITKQINKVRDSETLDASTKKSRLNTLIARRNKIAENVERILDRIGR